MGFISDEFKVDIPKRLDLGCTALFAVSAIGATAFMKSSKSSFEAGSYLVDLVLVIFLIYHMTRKRNWARVVITLLTIVGVMAQLLIADSLQDFLWSSTEPMWRNIVNIVFCAGELFGLYLLYSNESNIWFAIKN